MLTQILNNKHDRINNSHFNTISFTFWGSMTILNPEIVSFFLFAMFIFS